MMRKLIIKLKAPSHMAFFLAILISCNPKNTENANGTSENETSDSVTLSESQFTAGQMELGKITLQEFNTIVKANGVFDVPPENKTMVSAYFAGYIKNLTLLVGEAVTKGQVLFTLENPEYVLVQQNYLEARGRLNYLKSDYERQKTLMEADVTSQKNFLKAESDYNVTQAQYQSLKKQLELMNIDPNTLSPENIRATISVRSPLSGFVTAIPVTQGMFLNPSDVAMTITNMADMHLELKIFEKDLPYIKEGQVIKAKLQSDSEKIFMAEIHFVNKAINAVDRSVEIHGDLVNPEDVKLLTPGMYIEAEIITNSHIYPALPVEAISNIETDYYVLVKESGQSFKKKLVQVGITKDGYTQILNASDFDSETEFLTKGVFNLITD